MLCYIEIHNSYVHKITLVSAGAAMPILGDITNNNYVFAHIILQELMANIIMNYLAILFDDSVAAI